MTVNFILPRFPLFKKGKRSETLHAEPGSSGSLRVNDRYNRPLARSVLLVIVLFLSAFQLRAADYYWVGGGGNWSDLNHWRLGSSAGSIPSIVPSSGDNVFFDANSGFTAGSKIVTLDANGFCNNMTWSSVPNSPTFVTANVAFKVQLSGSLSLSPTITYNVVMNFKGATAATLTSNGTVLGPLGIDVDKTGGSLTVTDSLIIPSASVAAPNTNGFTLTSGTFDISGKKMTVYTFNSENTNVRTLEMTNATLNAVTTGNSGYVVNLSNKTINATGSTITAGAFRTDGGTYNRVTVSSAAGPSTNVINTTTFKALTFSPVSGIYSDIGFGNTVDTLVFNGQGYIGDNNMIGSARFAGVGSIGGTGNIIRSITTLNTFDVTGNPTNTVDSVMLAANRTATFRGTFNINKYFYVPGASCDAVTEINGDSTAGTVNFAAGAVVDINNVILTGVKATGPGIPFAVNGVDGGSNTGFTITEPSGTGTTLYWVGGSGDWNTKSHWSTTSGGAGGACIPFKNDNVVFDANSGLASATVTTSSTSFCNNITWAAGVGTMTFSESATSSFRVYGSAVLQPTVTMNAALELIGTSTATLTTNGGGAGGFSIYVVKTGSGSVTLTDNWINPAGATINLTSGTLNMAGRTVSVFIFTSSSGLTRNLDISNATITTNLRWQYLGNNKTITSTGSHITAQGTYQVNGPGSNYSWVDLTETASERIYSLVGTTFGQLTFTSTSATSAANVANSNTIRRLEFKGAGTVSGGSNNIDSLILAGSRNYPFVGTNTINKYFKAQATPCTGLTEIRSNTTSTLAFGSTAVVEMANVYMQNMTATGAITPIAFNGANAGGNTGWTISSAAGAARYWVGGSGDWNDGNHWSATSGGAAGACVPTVYDDVYFDAGSGFTGANKTVTVNTGNAYFRNINWTGAPNSPIWSKAASWTIEVWGDSVILNPTATFNVSPITLKGGSPAFMKNQVLGDFDVTIDKLGSGLTLLNDYSNVNTSFALINGAFNAPGLVLNVSAITNSGSNVVSNIDINNSIITTAFWNYSGTVANHTLNAANSKITAATFTATGLNYNVVNVTGIANTSAVFSSANIDSLTFTNTNAASAAGINGTGNTLNIVEYKGAGSIYATGNSIDTLIFFPGNKYTFIENTTTTINGEWYGSGTPCKATEIVSGTLSGSPPTANATIIKNSGDVNFDYIRLSRITASGSASPFVARSHSTDLGNNVNWNIAPYNGAAPILGLGPDTVVDLTELPIVLHTDGFFGSPSSQYTWNNNSTADTLLVSAPGTYSVSVSFPDGCSISDAIMVIDAATLPITLVNFTAKAANCQILLNWQIADAVNFSHFVVERSADGSHFEAIASLPYTGAANYAYTDMAAGNGINHYRIKMLDIDGKYDYSKIIPVTINCASSVLKVYPTITKSLVQIILPQVYERANIQVYTVSGQRVNAVVKGSGTSRSVDLGKLPDGLYILQIVNGNAIKTYKLKKE